MKHRNLSLKRSAAAIALLGLLVLSAATAAWACTVQARIVTLAPSSGSVGTMVAVRGEGLPVGTPTEIRWNNQAGPALGTAVADGNGAFLVQIEIPEAAPGVYSIMAAAQGFGLARTAFEVFPNGSAVQVGTGAHGTSAVSPDLWNGFGRSSSPQLTESISTGDPEQAPRLALGIVFAVTGAGALASGVFIHAAAKRSRSKASKA